MRSQPFYCLDLSAAVIPKLANPPSAMYLLTSTTAGQCANNSGVKATKPARTPTIADALVFQWSPKTRTSNDGSNATFPAVQSARQQ